MVIRLSRGKDVVAAFFGGGAPSSGFPIGSAPGGAGIANQVRLASLLRDAEDVVEAGCSAPLRCAQRRDAEARDRGVPAEHPWQLKPDAPERKYLNDLKCFL